MFLPAAAYTEKQATYVNTEGRAQYGQRVIFPPGDAREDWSIVRALAERVGHTLPYDSLEQVRARLRNLSPVFNHMDDVVVADWEIFGQAGSIEASAFTYPVDNYYQTDPISRASQTMAQCTQEFVLGGTGKATGTDG